MRLSPVPSTPQCKINQDSCRKSRQLFVFGFGFSDKRGITADGKRKKLHKIFQACRDVCVKTVARQSAGNRSPQSAFRAALNSGDRRGTTREAICRPSQSVSEIRPFST